MEIELRRHVSATAGMLHRNFAAIRERGTGHIEDRATLTAAASSLSAATGSTATRSTATSTATTTLATLRRLSYRHTEGDSGNDCQNHH